MNVQKLKMSLVFVGLVALGVGTRYVPYLTSLGNWNLNAVLAVSLFAGFYFRNLAVAAAAPLLALLLSDVYLESYDRQMALAVYGAQLLPIVAGPWLRRRLAPVRIGASAVAASVFFFAVSNAAYWWCYLPHTAASLMKAYVDAIPFYQGTLVGNLAFTFALFGLHALATSPARETDAAVIHA